MKPRTQPGVDLSLGLARMAPQEVLAHHRDAEALKVEGDLEPPGDSFSGRAVVVHDLHCTVILEAMA